MYRWSSSMWQRGEVSHFKARDRPSVKGRKHSRALSTIPSPQGITEALTLSLTAISVTDGKMPWLMYGFNERRYRYDRFRKHQHQQHCCGCHEKRDRSQQK